MPAPAGDPFTFASVGALYPSARRGLAADLLAADALGGRCLPVCSALVMAGRGVVTDVTEVPVDAVSAQLEHLASTAPPGGLKATVLADHRTAEVVFRAAGEVEGPFLLDLKLSGPSGETVLTQRGIEVVREHLGVPDLVVLSRTDAELLSGGEIRSLDDAQVAAQRLTRQGARAVVVKAGPLPARFFEGDGGEPTFHADLYFDGSDFALFEAPHLPGVATAGASSTFAVAILQRLIAGEPHERALQLAKQHVTDWLRDRPRSDAP